uniref:F-box domain-containing protein n=1 Tax=Vitrella brassicaformis TaxID=1169539 RepID=A0A7S1JRT4_9ALVE
MDRLPPEHLQASLGSLNVPGLLVARAVCQAWRRSVCEILRQGFDVSSADTTTSRTSLPDEGLFHQLATSFGTRKWSLARISRILRVFDASGHVSARLTSDSDFVALHHRLSRWGAGREAPNADLVHLFNKAGRRLHTVTQDDAPVWLVVDLGPFLRLTPSAYSLRHNSKGCAPRNWDFYASADGDRWTLLRQHRGDTALQQEPGSAARWCIDDPSSSASSPPSAHSRRTLPPSFLPSLQLPPTTTTTIMTTGSSSTSCSTSASASPSSPPHPSHRSWNPRPATHQRCEGWLASGRVGPSRGVVRPHVDGVREGYRFFCVCMPPSGDRGERTELHVSGMELFGRLQILVS